RTELVIVRSGDRDLLVLKSQETITKPPKRNRFNQPRQTHYAKYVPKSISANGGIDHCRQRQKEDHQSEICLKASELAWRSARDLPDSWRIRSLRNGSGRNQLGDASIQIGCLLAELPD